MTKIKPDDPLKWLAYFMLEQKKNKASIQGVSHELLHKMKMKVIGELASKEEPMTNIETAKCGCLLSKSVSAASSINFRSTQVVAGNHIKKASHQLVQDVVILTLFRHLIIMYFHSLSLL